MKMMLIRTGHTAYSRMMMMITLIAFHSVCKSVQPPIMHPGLYSALLLGTFLLIFFSHNKSFQPQIIGCLACAKIRWVA